MEPATSEHTLEDNGYEMYNYLTQGCTDFYTSWQCIAKIHSRLNDWYLENWSLQTCLTSQKEIEAFSKLIALKSSIDDCARLIETNANTVSYSMEQINRFVAMNSFGPYLKSLMQEVEYVFQTLNPLVSEFYKKTNEITKLSFEIINGTDLVAHQESANSKEYS